jgi:hypothetical protein
MERLVVRDVHSRWGEGEETDVGWSIIILVQDLLRDVAAVRPAGCTWYGSRCFHV